MTWVEDIRAWEDIGKRTWGNALQEIIGKDAGAIWIEKQSIPARAIISLRVKVVACMSSKGSALQH